MNDTLKEISRRIHHEETRKREIEYTISILREDFDKELKKCDTNHKDNK